MALNGLVVIFLNGRNKFHPYNIVEPLALKRKSLRDDLFCSPGF